MRVLIVTGDWPGAADAPHTAFMSRQADFLRQAGVEVDVFVVENANTFGGYWKAFWRLRKQLRQQRYDIVHAQSGQNGALAWASGARPLVLSLQGYDVHTSFPAQGPTGRLSRRLSRLAARRADETVVAVETIIPHVPARAYHVLLHAHDPATESQAAKDLIGIYQRARAAYAAQR